MEEREGITVQFIINGTEFQVSGNDKYTPESKLVDFIRDDAGLKGTKYMCREGGCGACVVTVRTVDPKTGVSTAKAVNSCLTPVLGCNGWDISTVESLGNKKDGYHPLQQRLVNFSGTQCGYCSPGMAMSMYSLLESKQNVKMEDVENNLDGNICRCTGYRPILDAFKSFAVDASEELRKRCADIEDCSSCPCPLRSGLNGDLSTKRITPSPLTLELSSGQQWVKATKLSWAFKVLNSFKAKGSAYRIVAGNTGAGVFRMNPAKQYLDVSDVSELKKYTLDTSGVVLGSCTTLSIAIQLLKKAAQIEGFSYTKQISKHLQRVANVPVRNIATLGGNLMLKQRHREFPSDVFTLMEAVGAKILVASDFPNAPKMYTMVEFLHMDMEGKLVISLYLPQRKGDFRFRSFKITRRYQNAHAYINGGILMKIDPEQDFKVLEKPRIVFGGVAPDFVHASGAELALMDKCLSDEKTLKRAMEALDIEINPNVVPGEASPSYRKSLCKSLLYKTILGLISENVKKTVQSGGNDIIREVSKGKQTFETDKGTTALYKAMPKLEATFQVSGEAEYINDIPSYPNELHGAFVLTSIANAELKSVDPSNALAIKGVHQYIDAKDIPGVNNYMLAGIFPVKTVQPIFVHDKVEAAGLPIGLILASSREIAVFAASKVLVEYKNKQKPIVTIADALKKIKKDGTMDKHISANFTSKKTPDKEAKHVIKGTQKHGGQYHYHMETQNCLCIPKEDSIDVYSATQWMDHVQGHIAAVLNVPNNYVNIHVKRIGGAFGAKLTGATLIATACAVAAHVTNRPVRIVLDMESNMKIIGKRSPYSNKYEVKFDENGKILELKASIFCDAGCYPNEADSSYGSLFYQNVYAADGWDITAGFVTTNTPANTFSRAPGSISTIAFIEYIMDHISFVLKKDPFEVRAENYRKEGDPSLITGQPLHGENLIPKLVEEIKVSGEYEQRKKDVEKFNQENRWKKRGLSGAVAAYAVEFLDQRFPVYVAIYHGDGTIAVSHSGIEMGQGVNTKVAQVVAHTLEVSLEKIKIKPTNNLIGNNAFISGASITSELCCNGALQACKVLVERMKPIKEKLGPDATWEKVVADCFAAKIDLSSYHMSGPKDKVQEYLSWVVNISEVEVDVLTGEYKILRVDLLEDAGKSLSPLVDIGQIEGGYLMGQGLWTMEKLDYDEETGQLLTNRTWSYKAPESKDVPEDFRVSLLANSPNPYGVLRSKAVGEPPICSSVGVVFALQNAISSARQDAGNTDWVQIDGPVTPEDVVRLSQTKSSDFSLY